MRTGQLRCLAVAVALLLGSAVLFFAQRLPGGFGGARPRGSARHAPAPTAPRRLAVLNTATVATPSAESAALLPSDLLTANAANTKHIKRLRDLAGAGAAAAAAERIRTLAAAAVAGQPPASPSPAPVAPPAAAPASAPFAPGHDRQTSQPPVQPPTPRPAPQTATQTLAAAAPAADPATAAPAPAVAAAATATATTARGLPRVLFTVKTTNDLPHAERTGFIRETWYTRAPADTYFFTESVPPPDAVPPTPVADIVRAAADDAAPDAPPYAPPAAGPLTGTYRDHWITTGCPPSHGREALCCKTNAQMAFFYAQNDAAQAAAEAAGVSATVARAAPRYEWFCHFDDDQYVLPEVLWRFLSEPVRRNALRAQYIGKRSLPDGIPLRDGLRVHFGTGGAGYCMSVAAMERARPHVLDGGFARLCSESGAPDDVTVGYLFHVKLQPPVALDESDLFHSHLEHQSGLQPVSAHVSYGTLGSSYPVKGYTNPSRDNFANVPDLWPKEKDIMKFKALHCHLFPRTEYCPKRSL